MGQLHNFLTGTELPPSGTLGEKMLPYEVLQHLRALRIRVSEKVRFMDGTGNLIEANCVNEKPYAFEIVRHWRARAIAPIIELCLAPPRGDALKEAVTQATEVGASSIRFLKTEHLQFAAGQEAPILKMQRVSDAACEQCGRAWRCEIVAGWHSLSETLRLPGVHIVADEALSASAAEQIGFAKLPDFDDFSAPLRLYIGPEGGWSANERQLFDGKAAPLSLGSLILRVPTATVAGIHFLRSVAANR